MLRWIVLYEVIVKTMLLQCDVLHIGPINSASRMNAFLSYRSRIVSCITSNVQWLMVDSLHQVHWMFILSTMDFMQMMPAVTTHKVIFCLVLLVSLFTVLQWLRTWFYGGVNNMLLLFYTDWGQALVLSLPYLHIYVFWFTIKKQQYLQYYEGILS